MFPKSKSNIKRLNSLGCLDQYTAPISKYTRDVPMALLLLQTCPLERLTFFLSNNENTMQMSKNPIGFMITYETEAQGLPSPKSIMILIVLRCFCILGPNLDILTWNLSHGHAQKKVKFNFQVEGQGQSPLKIIGILTNISGPNLVILAWMTNELSRGQTHDWYTNRDIQAHKHAQTYRQLQATTLP